MDLEQLTKHQIILLTLLVSFVTSIATGIVTVSLMDQAPPGVTRVINQIVEHTVEKVVPQTQGAAIVTEKTVVVKDDDLASQSIATAQKAIVHIVAKGGDLLIARGIVIDGKGTALTDRTALNASAATEFEALLASGERMPLTIRKQVGSSSPIAVIDIKVGTSTGFAPAPLADLSKLRLGQSVIRIGGTGNDIVGQGVIAALPTKDIPAIQTSVTAVTPGSLVMTIFGEIIGITTGDSQSIGNEFYTIATIPAAAPAPVETKLKTGS